MKFRDAIRRIIGQGTSVYRGMWLTAEELVGVVNYGIDPTKSNYKNHIFFSDDPAEAIRYGQQGASMVGSSKPEGILVLIAADPQTGKIAVRERPDGTGKMSSATALETVSGEAITGVWVYDPTLSDSSPMRRINFKNLLTTNKLRE